ncbi:PPC domain-containing protein [Candidatus Zixiibacteriota bacterium]
MIRIFVPILALSLSITSVSAQQSGPLPEEVTSVAEQVTDLLLDALPRQARDPLTVSTSGFEVAGSGMTQLGMLFSSAITNRLANEGDRRITVLAQVHQMPADADYMIQGSLFRTDTDLLVVVQLIRTADMAVAGGFERSFTATDPLRALLDGLGPSGQGGDPYEPDGRDSPQPLTIGSMVSSHTVMPEGDLDWFLLSLDDLEGLAVIEVNTSGATDTYLTVFGPDDPFELVTENDDADDHNARVTFTAGRGQKYWISVGGYDESITGSYGIIARMDVYGDDPLESNDRMEVATPLPVDGEWISTLFLPSGDIDWFVLDVTASEVGATVLTVETEGDLDTWIDFFDVSGEQIAEDDDGSGTGNARLRFTVEESGRYYARVRLYDESGTGPYDIRATLERAEPDEFEPDNVPEDATPLMIDGEAQSHTFTPAEDTDWFTFDIRSGMTVTIETYGDNDTVMRVLDIEGNMVAEDDDSGENANALIRRFLPEGTYHVEVSQFPDSGGSGSVYSLRIISG